MQNQPLAFSSGQVEAKHGATCDALEICYSYVLLMA